MVATQFEFRFLGASAPDGELDADDVIALVQSLKDVAIRLGREETEAEPVGRPTNRTRRVASLTIGMAPGSTRLLVRRADEEDVLEIELPEDLAFDERFQALMECIADDERPGWVSRPLAQAANRLRGALQHAAPVVEFSAGGVVRRSFKTADTHVSTWVEEPDPGTEQVSLVGRLRAVNLDSHRLQVTDDVGNRIALPNVGEDERLGRLLNEYVHVTGTPERDERGRLTHVHEAVLTPAPALPAGIVSGPASVQSMDEILAAAPGPPAGGLEDLTQEEMDRFLEALGM